MNNADNIGGFPSEGSKYTVLEYPYTFNIWWFYDRNDIANAYDISRISSILTDLDVPEEYKSSPDGAILLRLADDDDHL